MCSQEKNKEWYFMDFWIMGKEDRMETSYNREE